MATVYMVTAGNIIDDYNEKNDNTDNVVELFDNLEAAEQFGSLFDFHQIEMRELHSVGIVAQVHRR